MAKAPLIPGLSFLSFLLLLCSSCCCAAWVIPPAPAAHPQPPQAQITPFVILPRQQDPQVQALSSQLSLLSQQSRSASQSLSQQSQQLSISSQQLSQQSQQLANRLAQTEAQLASARVQINGVEQASRSASQQAAEASRRVDETRRSAEQEMRRMSESMVRVMTERERQMSESVSRLGGSFSSALASATQSVVRAQQDREQQQRQLEAGEGGGNDAAIKTALAIVGGVVGGVVLSLGAGLGVWMWRRNKARKGGKGGAGARKWGGGLEGKGGSTGSGVTIGFPELKSTSNRAYASVGLGKDGIAAGNNRDSAESFYSTDYEKGGMMGLGDFKMPEAPPAVAAMDAPDLRVALMSDVNRTKSLSRKSVGGGTVVGKAVAEQVQPPMPGLAMSYYGLVQQAQQQVQTPTIATATVTIPAKGIRSNSNSSKDGGKFQLGNPPPPRAGKFTLFPKSRDEFNSPLGTSTTISSAGSGKSTSTKNRIPSLDTWLRNGVGTVSPFATLKKGQDISPA